MSLKLIYNLDKKNCKTLPRRSCLATMAASRPSRWLLPSNSRTWKIILKCYFQNILKIPPNALKQRWAVSLFSGNYPDRFFLIVVDPLLHLTWFEWLINKLLQNLRDFTLLN